MTLPVIKEVLLHRIWATIQDIFTRKVDRLAKLVAYPLPANFMTDRYIHLVSHGPPCFWLYQPIKENRNFITYKVTTIF